MPGRAALSASMESAEEVLPVPQSADVPGFAWGTLGSNIYISWNGTAKRLEWSSDLVTWNLISTESSVLFVDPIGFESPARFYRIID
jgi:hypothetical protein